MRDTLLRAAISVLLSTTENRPIKLRRIANCGTNVNLFRFLCSFIDLDVIIAVQDQPPSQQDINNACFNVVTPTRTYELMAHDEQEKLRYGTPYFEFYSILYLFVLIIYLSTYLFDILRKMLSGNDTSILGQIRSTMPPIRVEPFDWHFGVLGHGFQEIFFA